MKKKLLIVDGNNILYRSYYATAYSGASLTSSDGTPTGAVYAFANILNKIIKDLQPTHLVVVLDKGKHTFRSELSPDYKGTRKPAPDDLVPQFSLLRDMLDVMDVKYLESEDYEADDFAGSLANRFSNEDIEIYILSSDKDTYQLLSDKVSVLVPKSGVSQTVVMTPELLKEELELEPSQIIELKALAGDKSDNIKGVQGVGEKTAIKLLNQYKTCEGIYEHIEEIKGKLKEKLINDKESCFLSKELATIKIDIPLDCSLEDYTLHLNTEKANEFFSRYGMRTLIRPER